jgi:hypothetical protein
MQSLERIHAHADDLHELTNTLDRSSRKHPLRRVHSFDYHTSPSNRKGRVLLGEEAAELKRRLRHVKSDETNCSGTTLRGSSVRSRPAGAGSAFRFCEAEVRRDMGLGGESSFKARLEEARERQYRFGRKKSMERWKGIGWTRGRRRGGGMDGFDVVDSP